MDVIRRRVELLKLEGLGFTQAEIVKELCQKVRCSRRTVYNDFESRSEWQPALQSLVKSEDSLLKVVNRYEEIYRQASRRMMTATNELAQVAALNVMLKANSLMFETAILPEIMSRLKALEDKAEKGVFVQ